MFADFPPSSSATRFSDCDASSATRLPARVEPVNETMSISGWDAIASPTSAPVPGHEVEHARREAGVVDHLGEHERVERRDLARLQHDRAARGHRVRDLGRDLVQRVVPRRDATDDTDGLAHDEAVAVRLLVLVAAGQRARLRERVDRETGLHDEAEPLGHARFAGDDRRDLVHAAAEPFGDAGHELAALLGVAGRPLGERGARGLARPCRRPRRCRRGSGR